VMSTARNMATSAARTAVRNALRALAIACMGCGAALLGPSPPTAQACGGFFVPRHKSVPVPYHEQVLLIYDPVAGKEHFVRAVSFGALASPFGFVVPTPSRPEVFPVAESPFGPLGHRFDFVNETGHVEMGWDSARGVSVLEQKRVGSFDAFVLAATDERALAKWLSDQHFSSTKRTDAWLAHYVRLGFHFVALRYEPPPAATGFARRVTETLRITFSTPVPFCPYLEPDHPEQDQRQDRLLELWLVSPEPVVPVALRQRAGAAAWVQPFRAGLAFDPAQDELRGMLGPELARLLPAGDLGLQTFQDQKWSRSGFGDVLFVPVKQRTMGAAERKKLEPLLPILDPALLPATETKDRP
jgi:Uncharacterized protein conserved in bacteria (DUF2330)